MYVKNVQLFLTEKWDDSVYYKNTLCTAEDRLLVYYTNVDVAIN